MLFWCILATVVVPGIAQTLNITSLTVATYPVVPFVFINDTVNQWKCDNREICGFSIEYFELLFPFLQGQIDTLESSQFVNYKTKEAALAATESGEADVAIAAYTLSSDLIDRVQATHPYFLSGVQIGVITSSSGLGSVNVWGFLSPFSTAVWISFLVGCFTAGTVMWLMESSVQPEAFPPSFLAGFKEGAWWAFMMLFHASNKFPKTTSGRAFAIGWSLLGLVFGAAYTANLTALLSVQSVGSGITDSSDLEGKTVGFVVGTEATNYVSRYASTLLIETVPYPDFDSMLAGLTNDNIDAVLADSAELLWTFLTKREREDLDDFAVRGNLVFTQRYRYTIAVSPELPIEFVNKMNLGILDVAATLEYDRLVSRWMTSIVNAEGLNEESAQFGFWDFGGIWLALIVIATFSSLLWCLNEQLCQSGVRTHAY